MSKLINQADPGRVFLAGLVFVLVLTLSALTAFAHAKLLRSDPQANAKLKEAPKSVQLWFSEELEPQFNTIRVSDQSGKHVDKNNVTLSEGGKKLQIDLEELAPGTYTVEWKSLSTDQHTMKGKFNFTVLPSETTALATPTQAPGRATSTPSQSSQSPERLSAPTQESATDWTMSFVRWWEYMAMMTLFGGFALRLLVLGPSLRQARKFDARGAANALKQSERRFAQLSWLGILLLLLTTLASLVLQTSTVLDTTVSDALSPSKLVQVITQTNFGKPWLLQVASVLALGVIVFLIAKSDKRGHPKLHSEVENRSTNTSDVRRVSYDPASGLLWMGLAINALIFLAPSLTGHAAAASKEYRFAVFSDWLHLAAASLWVGGLFHLALTMRRAASELERPVRLRVLRSVIPKFTRIAVVSTLLIGFTGIYNSWLHVDSFSALWSTPYGKTLLIKVVLFIPMLALGGVNTFIIHPRAKRTIERESAGGESDHSAPDRGFYRSIAVEAGLGVAVLLAAAVLVFLQPAREHPVMPMEKLSQSFETRQGS